MKKIGMIGGLSCESSAEYYLRITSKSRHILGNHNTVEVIMISVNMAEILEMVDKNNWHLAEEKLISTAQQLEKMGSDCVVLPCNTLHKLAKSISKSIGVPLISIMDCLGEHIKLKKYTKVGLLGTAYTMEDSFYRQYLYEKFNIQTEIPLKNDREYIHKIIFNELCHGIVRQDSKEYLKQICKKLHDKDNCDAIILGCTELPLIINNDEVESDLIDTIDVHTNGIINFSVSSDLLRNPHCDVAIHF